MDPRVNVRSASADLGVHDAETTCVRRAYSKTRGSKPSHKSFPQSLGRTSGAPPKTTERVSQVWDLAATAPAQGARVDLRDLLQGSTRTSRMGLNHSANARVPSSSRATGSSRKLSVCQ